MTYRAESHHLRAMYTPPYLVDPMLPSLAINGIPPIDLGLVLPGNSVVVPLPPGTVDHTAWTIYDPDIVTARPQRFRLSVALP